MEKWLEKLIIFPHVSGLKAELNVDLVPQADAHDLVQIIAGRLGGRKMVGIEDGDV